MTVPVVLALGLLLGGAGDDKPAARQRSAAPAVLAPIIVAAPPSDAAAESPCTKVLQALPVQLGTLAPRVVHSHPDSPFVVAWGDPAVVLRCGVARPSRLVASSGDLAIGVDGVYFLPTHQKQATAFTAIDRAAYVEVSVPSTYAQPPLGPLADAIAKALPAVCVVDPKETDTAKLCTHRP